MQSEKRVIFIIIKSEKDFLGRQSFVMQWESNQLGYARNLSGYFTQHFYSVVNEHTERLEKDGAKIEFLKKEFANPHIDIRTGLLITHKLPTQNSQLITQK